VEQLRPAAPALTAAAPDVASQPAAALLSGATTDVGGALTFRRLGSGDVFVASRRCVIASTLPALAAALIIQN
jgi:hypothetical protein